MLVTSLDTSSLAVQSASPAGHYIRTSIPMFAYEHPVIFSANPGREPMTPSLLQKLGLDQDLQNIAGVALRVDAFNVVNAIDASDEWEDEGFSVVVTVPAITTVFVSSQRGMTYRGRDVSDLYTKDDEGVLTPRADFISDMRALFGSDGQAIVAPPNLEHVIHAMVANAYARRANRSI